MSLVSTKEAKAEAKAATPSRYLEQRFWYGLCNRKSTDWGPSLAGKHVYLLGDHGKATEPEMIGVEVASSTVGVWISDKPEPVLDGLQRLLHEEYYEGVSTVTLGNLANITQKHATLDFLPTYLRNSSTLKMNLSSKPMTGRCCSSSCDRPGTVMY
jgi:hypothetical protein